MANNDKWNKLSPEEKIDIIMVGYRNENDIVNPYVIENGKIYIALTDGHEPELDVQTIQDFITTYEKRYPEFVEEFGR